VFTDDNFLPAETTNNPADSWDMAATWSGYICYQTRAVYSNQTPQITPEENYSENSNMLNTSRNLHDGKSIPNIVKTPTRINAFNKTSPREILQIPHVRKSSTGEIRRRGKAAIWPHLPTKKTLKSPRWTRHQERSSSESWRKNQCLYKIAQPPVIRMTQHVYTTMNCTLCQLKVG
jgi:hypothetical protein